MNTSDMFLVYRDEKGNQHTQHWSDLVEVGTLIDPDTGDDMELIGWTTSSADWATSSAGVCDRHGGPVGGDETCPCTPESTD